MTQIVQYTLFISLFWGGTCLATISTATLKFTNASRVVIPETSSAGSSSGTSTVTTGTPIVYGGIAGDSSAGTCSAATDVTCNNCIGNNEPCNANRILPTAYLRIEFQTDNQSVITSTSTIFLMMDSTKIEPTAGHHSTVLAVKTSLFVEIPWSQICAAMGSENCATPVAVPKTFQVGISVSPDTTIEEAASFQVYLAGIPSTATDYANYQYFTPCPDESSVTEDDGGYCSLEIQRGDEKVYIANEIHGANFNQAPGGVLYKYLRVYYSPSSAACVDAGFQTEVTSASPYVDLTFSEQTIDGVTRFVIDDPTIIGLTNGTTYYFRFANVDEAGNVFYFSGDNSLSAIPALAAKNYLNCTQHSAIPAEVVGMLEGKECFIATAVFGSSMAPQLNILRAFRDQILKNNSIGRWFVTKYYENSPRWAQSIKKRPLAKAVVRATLSPIISMAQWTVLYGFRSFMILASLGFILGFFVVRRLVRDDD